MTGTIGGGAGREAAVPPMLDAGSAAGSDPPTSAAAGSPSRLQPRSEPAPRTAQDDELYPHSGLFGPETITWRVHSDPLMGLATLRSLVMRVLHPEGLHGVFATAQRVDDPWERLSWTTRQLGVISFGGTTEALMTAARLRAVLMQVGGVGPGGQDYRGDDPDLLLWMHCCQVSSFVEVTRRGGLPLTDREHETYVREQVRLASIWGLEPDQVPASRRELTRYFRSVRPRLRMTSAGRAFIGAIVGPALPDLMTLTQRNRPSWAAVGGLAFGALPSWARRLYGSAPATGSSALSQHATTVALHSLRDSLRGLDGSPA